jgi:hypothetical protein
MRRRLALLPIALGAVALALPPSGEAATLPAPSSLADALAQALRAGQPLVVMASLHGCPFCRVVRDHYLAPLRETGQAVVQLDMGDSRAVRGFDGRPTTHAQQLRDWGVEIAPTVLFFGRNGREIAERLAGASIPDFYGAYLEERLVQARRSLR